MSRPNAGLLMDRHRLRWLVAVDDAKSGRSSPALRNGGRAVIELERAAPVRVRPRQLDGNDARPPAPGRDPCPRCATRGDLGCDHFAPCDPVDHPREARGLLTEKRDLRPGGRPRAPARRFTPAEDRELLALKAQGLNGEKIAARLGRGRGTIYVRLEKLADG